VAPLPEMRQGMPEDLRRALFPMPPVLPPAIRLAERKQTGSARLGPARKIAKRLHDRWGGATEEEYEFPPKPPRMRWATYNRLEEQYNELENATDARWTVRIMTTLPNTLTATINHERSPVLLTEDATSKHSRGVNRSLGDARTVHLISASRNGLRK